MKLSNPLSLLAEDRLVPVVVIDDAAHAVPVGEALLAGGLRLAEVTFRTLTAVESIRGMSSVRNLTVGAGTIIRTDQVDEAVAAGAQFVVTPGLSANVVERCRELEVPVVPGVATASEIMAALDLGIEVVKFFPAEASGGVATLRALAAPFPQLRFVPTGGISETNAASYLGLESVLAVGGSWMVSRAMLRANDFTEVARQARFAARLARPSVGTDS